MLGTCSVLSCTCTRTGITPMRLRGKDKLPTPNSVHQGLCCVALLVAAFSRALCVARAHACQVIVTDRAPIEWNRISEFD